MVEAAQKAEPVAAEQGDPPVANDKIEVTERMSLKEIKTFMGQHGNLSNQELVRRTGKKLQTIEKWRKKASGDLATTKKTRQIKRAMTPLESVDRMKSVLQDALEECEVLRKQIEAASKPWLG